MASQKPGYFDPVGWGEISLLTSYWIILPVAVLLGAMAGMGIGGGSLLILWLTIIMGVDTETASTINLLFFLAAAGAVSFLRWKKRTLRIKKVLPGILAGCLAAMVVGLFRTQIREDMMRKLFGVFLLLVGIRELFYRDKKAK